MDNQRDEELRKILGKILGAPVVDPTSPFYPGYPGPRRDRAEMILSWEEIFCEIGKLQERATNNRNREF